MFWEKLPWKRRGFHAKLEGPEGNLLTSCLTGRGLSGQRQGSSDVTPHHVRSKLADTVFWNLNGCVTMTVN